MEMSYYVDNIKLMTTGDLLKIEIPDETIEKAINMALQELNRYYNVSQFVAIGRNGSCVDLAKVEEDNKVEINYVANVFRTNALSSTNDNTTSSVDPVYASYWTQTGSYYMSTNKMYDYVAYNIMNQLQNTSSTDLRFTEDQVNKKLYVNLASNESTDLTIEFVPVLKTVEQVSGNYWIDILNRLGLAYLKIILGRIRTRYTQSNALWTQDGDNLLNEGKEELNALRERLQQKANVTYPMD